MSFGMEVYNAAGQLTLSRTDRLTRTLFRRVVGANESGSAVIDLNGARNPEVFAALASSTAPSFPFNVPHIVELVGALVSWTRQEHERVRGDSLIVVVAYE